MPTAAPTRLSGSGSPARARDLLGPAGLDLTYREAPIGHWIEDGPTIDAARDWLEKAIPAYRL